MSLNKGVLHVHSCAPFGFTGSFLMNAFGAWFVNFWGISLKAFLYSICSVITDDLYPVFLQTLRHISVPLGTVSLFPSTLCLSLCHKVCTSRGSGSPLCSSALLQTPGGSAAGRSLGTEEVQWEHRAFPTDCLCHGVPSALLSLPLLLPRTKWEGQTEKWHF